MPTECERSVTSPSTGSGIAAAATATAGGEASAALIASEIQSSHLNEEVIPAQQSIMEGDMSTSQTSTTSNGSSCNGGRKTSITSPDPTAYVAKARVTRPTPPPPPHNPMQFVQIKPCNLYQTAQEQLKKAEEVKKIKEIRKEEPEDWQNNLDNWKSSRRKRVEHIIDRVVEVKKLELEEHDRTRRKSKTFSEMIEDRVDRVGRPALKKLASLAVYNEDESNDLSDLGIGTSSASGKSSLSEDYDNNSVMSDNAAELDKAISNSNHKPLTDSTTREYISSPGYETSSSTAPASSPDPCEYTYEGAIQDYKQRVSRAAASGQTSQALHKLNASNAHNATQQQPQNSKESTPERTAKETSYPPRRGSKIEDRLIGFEVQSPSEECVGEKNKVDVPKIDISKRKEIFEAQSSANETKSQLSASVHSSNNNGGGVPRVTLRDRFKPQEAAETVELVAAKKDVKRLSGDITSIKERLQNLEQQQNLVNGANGANKTTANKLVDIPVPPLKERLSSLQNAVTKEEVRKPPVALVDARQLEIMKSEAEKAKQTIKEEVTNTTITTIIATTISSQTTTKNDDDVEVDRDDSGIHTADDIDVAEERLHTEHIKKEQELKLNAAIEALAMEEKQFAEAANAVNQIEAEFEELSLGSVVLPPLASTNNNDSSGTTTAAAVTAAAASTTTTITNDHMEYSVSSTNQHTSCLKSPPTPPTLSSSDSSNRSLLGNSAVKGMAPTTGSNLRRKPTNEMVHAKNLLKIFKDTFQNDIELDEDDNRHLEQETKTIPHDQATNEIKPLNVSVTTQILDSSSPKLPALSSQTVISSPKTPASTGPLSPTLARASQPLQPHPSSPVSNTMIPRCITPSGKPPMSPITVRSTTKFRDLETPPGSPSVNRKHDSQFSINGRVEIFNSKNMSSNANNSDNLAKAPPSPTITTKITYLPYITNAATSPPTTTPPSTTTTSGAATPKSSAPSNIVLHQQQTEQQQAAVATASQTKNQTTTSATTVIKPLLSTTEPEAAATTSVAAKKSLFEMKSMPSRQMVNEPQITTKPTIATNAANAATTVTATLDRETPHPNHSPGAMKQQQPSPQTTQQPEVVVCAPPITIVNPDELPKPNTVKNLSSCFQQHDASSAALVAAGGGKMISPKPLPRSRIPQATPPQSPSSVKRNVATSNAEKCAVSSASSPLDEEKKLSTISSSSTSSNSTVCTVIEANQKLSIVSNSSATSSDSVITPPLIVKTNAQIHKEPVRDVKSVGFAKQASSESKSSATEVTSEQPEKEVKSVGFAKQISRDFKPNAIKAVFEPADKEGKPVAASKQPAAATNSSDSKALEAAELKALLKDFLQTEIIFSETCETKPMTSTTPFEAKLQPLKVVVRDTEEVKGSVTADKSPQTLKEATTPNAAATTKITAVSTPQTPPVTTTSPSARAESKQIPLKIDISQGKPQSPDTPKTPLSPGSQLFRTTKPLVVSTLYDKYLPEEPKSPLSERSSQAHSTKSADLQPLSNMRATPSSPKPEAKPTTPTIVIPAELPSLVDCPPNDSTLYKLATSAPHSPVSTASTPDHSMAVDSALCASLLTSMAATPDFVNFNRQTTVEEDPCQKVDVEALPISDHTPATGFADVNKTDISQGKDSKVVCRMHDAPATQRQTTVEEEVCQKMDIRDLPDDQPKTDFKAVSPTQIRKCDNLFSAASAKPNSPIMEARAAHSKALIETCEKIIAEEKQANHQLKSTLPLSPKATPILPKKSKIPKPLPSCCLATESMNEADLKQRPTELRQASQPSTPNDDAVIARMHVVETQIKVTTTTPPTSPKMAAAKPQPSPQPVKKTKNIFDFIKKNFGVGGSSAKEEELSDGKYKSTVEPPTSAALTSDSKVLVLTPTDVQDYDTVKFDEIHNVDNSKFYLPTDDVAPPPLPKTPAPVNIEITRKIITDEIVEDGKTEMELTSEIDALLDVELCKLNHEIEELEKVGEQK